MDINKIHDKIDFIIKENPGQFPDGLKFRKELEIYLTEIDSYSIVVNEDGMFITFRDGTKLNRNRDGNRI